MKQCGEQQLHTWSCIFCCTDVQGGGYNVTGHTGLRRYNKPLVVHMDGITRVSSRPVASGNNHLI